jgi:hypothetical protein
MSPKTFDAKLRLGSTTQKILWTTKSITGQPGIQITIKKKSRKTQDFKSLFNVIIDADTQDSIDTLVKQAQQEKQLVDDFIKSILL